MPIRSFKSIPRDIVEWSRFFQSQVVTPDPGTITNETFGERTGNSVVGRAGSTVGTPADITLEPGEFLVNRSGTVTGATLTDADIPAGIARDTEVAAGDTAVGNAAAAALSAHEAAADPHTGYVKESTILDGSATYNPTNIVTGNQLLTTVTVTGAVAGDFALASFSLDLLGLKLSASVDAADTVTVIFSNTSGGDVNLASGTLRARVWRQ